MPSGFTSFHTTNLEEDLRKLREGPDAKWQADHHPEPQRRSSPPMNNVDVVKRLAAMQHVDTSPEGQAAAGAAPLLGCYLRNRLRQDYEQSTPGSLRQYCLDAVDKGGVELAELAANYLETNLNEKVGEVSSPGHVQVSSITWGPDGDPGRGTVTWNDEQWEQWDWRDRLHLDPALADLLEGVPENPDDPFARTPAMQYAATGGRPLVAPARRAS